MSNDTPPTDDDTPRNRNPLELSERLVALPLIERLEKLRESAAPASTTLAVVIDLNLNYEAGLAQARKSTIKTLLEIVRDPDQVDVRKSNLTKQYVFARLTAAEIQHLASAVYQPDPAQEPRSHIERVAYHIWPDFEIDQHVIKSNATVKADAARRSFQAAGQGVVWAVLDSGIDGSHEHFQLHDTLDLSDHKPPLRHMDFTQTYQAGNANDPLQVTKRENDAALTDPFGHGTHVAGIIAGEFVAATDANGNTEAKVSVRRTNESDAEDHREYKEKHISGIAPQCKLVSMKVLNERGGGAVSNILAALARIQEINENGRWIKIHGVNLSVGYNFNPEWFACGQSPLCVEVNRLVRSGVVVVCSAGNSGYGKRDTLMTEFFRSGMLMTINDPGNAELAITVGSTHRDMPHTFGTSFFSSKGPTGDGRVKPDLLAPGERIVSCASGKEKNRHSDSSHSAVYVDQSGTSMAAPHVSGAIAAFLSIRSEFIGQPDEVKKIFKDSATDLGRDRYMQGAGLLDLMRAIQSV